MDRACLEHAYQFLAQIFTRCPVREQQILMDLGEAIWTRIIIPVYETSEERKQEIAASTGEWIGKLRERFPVLAVDAAGDGLAFTPPAPAMRPASGIESFLWIDWTNHTSEAQHLSARFRDAPESETVRANVPPGETRPFLVAFTATREDTRIPLDFQPHTERPWQRYYLPIEPVAPARIRGTLHGQAAGETTPGRVHVLCSDHILRHGAAFRGNPTLSEKQLLGTQHNYRLPFFYSDGRFEIEVPPGPTELSLERGFEHPIVTQTIQTQSGETHEIALASERFLDMKSQGWISGDTHIHWAKNWWSEDEDLELLAMVQRAEDLRVANNLTLMHDEPPRPKFVAPTQRPMGPVPEFCDDAYHMQMGEEYRNDRFYGHINLLNITDLIHPISTGRGGSGGPDGFDFPTNEWAIREARAQGGISCEAHGLGPFNRSRVPANMAHGMVDCLDQIGAEDYYRFLDCNFRVPLGDGSDHPARVAGCARTYVRIEGDFSYEAWIDGIRKDRTFVTSGPLLFLSLNGHGIGDHFDAAPDEALHAEARAVSRKPLGRFQIVANGEVVASVDTQDTEAVLEASLPAGQPCWVAARCSVEELFTPMSTAVNPFLYRPDIAHTSAVFADVAGRAVFKAESARHWIGVLEAHAQDLEENAFFQDAAHKEESIQYAREAITRYQEMITRQS